MSEWKDIESAPKREPHEGADIDLWAIDEGSAEGGYRVANCKWVDDEWKTRSDRGWQRMEEIKFSHWIELPSPPTTEEGVG